MRRISDFGSSISELFNLGDMKKVILICVLLFVTVLAYSQNKVTPVVKINTFTQIPKEIDGCGCYFFLSKKDKNLNRYIAVNDFAQFAFIKIGSNVEKFKLVRNFTVGKIDVYLYSQGASQLKIEIKTKTQTGPESNSITGTMTIETPNNPKKVVDIIGDTGC